MQHLHECDCPACADDPSEFMVKVCQLRPGDVVRFDGQDEVVSAIVDNPGNRKLRNIHLRGIKSALVEHQNSHMMVVNRGGTA